MNNDAWTFWSSLCFTEFWFILFWIYRASPTLAGFFLPLQTFFYFFAAMTGDIGAHARKFWSAIVGAAGISKLSNRANYCYFSIRVLARAKAITAHKKINRKEVTYRKLSRVLSMAWNHERCFHEIKATLAIICRELTCSKCVHASFAHSQNGL